MSIKTLAERLVEKFGGEIKENWGSPIEKDLAATIKSLPEEPKTEDLVQIIKDYLNEYGFIPIKQKELIFQDSDKNNKYVSYAYFERVKTLRVTIDKC